jgi:glyoxylase-like metal-dependent hydrolase (beta-lactamase superfamily II)
MGITRLKLYECGYCTQPERIAYAKGGWKQVKFPAIVALLHHDKYGYILFDTGYARHFMEATKGFPYSIYAKLTPVFFQEQQSIKNQLLQDGISPDEIHYIILSHFHGDHTAGLKDFPDATILTFHKAYADIQGISKFAALRKGCLLDTLPSNIEDRMKLLDQQASVELPPQFYPFTAGYDVWGDGTVFAVDVTGHAIGQLGIFVTLTSGKQVFLCADAVWLSQTYQNLIYPSAIANILTADVVSYQKNIMKLHHLAKQNSELEILPTHCEYTWRKIQEGIVYE